jgi:hypothetical protein
MVPNPALAPTPPSDDSVGMGHSIFAIARSECGKFSVAGNRAAPLPNLDCRS